MPNNKTRILCVIAVVVLGLLVMAPPASAGISEKVLHSFCSAFYCHDGIQPNDLISDEAGNLYGTTQQGGGFGWGSVFELTPNNGKWTVKVLHSFNPDAKDGFLPQAGLIFDQAGNLYGTTSQGGAYNCGSNSCGTVFELIPNNGKWTEKVLHSFKLDCNGFSPYGSLIMDKAGNLYGTTTGLCTTDTAGGTVFQLTRNNGKWTEKLVYSFQNNSDGSPDHDVIFGKAGNLYGTTIAGGAYGDGTVFELIPSDGKWSKKVLYSFDDIVTSHGRLVFDQAGNLYGTTLNGGLSSCLDGCGYVFELTPHANGKWTEKVLHSFDNNGKDGYYPIAGLILDQAENLYGTTSEGGAVSVCVTLGGCGTVFELIRGKNGMWSEKILHNFELNDKDGNIPYTGLIFGKTGNLYGTTSSGGTSSSCGDGCGTVFEITP
jgi:uncharacterized repeat protein (TIGR03803 family)